MKAQITLCWLILTIGHAGAQQNPPSAQRGSSLPSPTQARAVCSYVAERGPTIASVLVANGILDANNDGEDDEVAVVDAGGTAHGDLLQFRRKGMPRNSDPIRITRDPAERFYDNWTFGERWLPYDGKVYTLKFASEEFRHVSYLGYIDPRNIEHFVCDFENVEHEKLLTLAMKRPVLAGETICERVAGGQVKYMPANEDHTLMSDRHDTDVAARVTVDFSNAGQETSLALLSYERSNRRGCYFQYYDVIAGDSIASTGNTHDTLMKLQRANIANRNPGPTCGGNTPRWFSDRGRTYFDNRWQSERLGTEPFHDVSIVHDGRVETLC
jgi:hypothetical protein